jgi:glucose/arabinose dehydrogenase
MLITACHDDNDSRLIVSDGPFANACNAADPADPAAAAVQASDFLPLGPKRVFPALSFTQPIDLRQEPADDRCWYVVERAGRILAFANDDAADTFTTYIDVTTLVDSTSFEGGLLGIAFHPDYADNGEVFLSYTGDDVGLTSFVSRFRSLDAGQTLDPDSEEVLLSLRQPFGNHNGGHIAFGPDGYLYIGFGDGGSGNDPGERAQNTMNLFGAILRIDVDSDTPYAIPSDNPFAGNALCSDGFGAAECPEIYAWGLRNPWRWSFDTESADLWLGDVGQGALEEIDIIDLGGNYGWPFFEGTRCNTEAAMINCSFVGIPPLTEYGRTEGRAVTGGFVYRGSEIRDLFGSYLYGDFTSGNLFRYFDDGNTVIEAQFETGLSISSFGQSNSGELFLVDFAAGGIYQIVPVPVLFPASSP